MLETRPPRTWLHDRKRSVCWIALAMLWAVSGSLRAGELQAQPAAGQTLADAWRQVLLKSPAPGEVREAVRRLAAEQRHAEATAAIEAALLEGQAQPWMYEALALALSATDADVGQIERAMLSAIDIEPPHPLNLLHVANRLDRAGAGRRALTLLDAVRRQWPGQRETYRLALPIAQAADDAAAIGWASLGILSEPPTRETQAAWDEADLAAARLAAQLRTARRHREADRFEADRREALARDLTATISWTGAADLDLIVEEPQGGICSAAARRSSGGGVFGPDAVARPDEAGGKPLSERYVAARAASGEYRLHVRRIWGRPTAGAAIVEVKVGVPEARIYRLTIAVDDDAVVRFMLDGGRRREKETERAERIADQVAGRREALRKHLVLPEVDHLAQVGAVLPGSGVAPGFVGAVTQRPFVMGVTPVVGPGGIGYMPNIVVLNEGTQLTTMAVVSPDRKRVRFTSSMMVSHVSGVTTFNIGTGQTSFQPLPAP